MPLAIGLVTAMALGAFAVLDIWLMMFSMCRIRGHSPARHFRWAGAVLGFCAVIALIPVAAAWHCGAAAVAVGKWCGRRPNCSWGIIVWNRSPRP